MLEQPLVPLINQRIHDAGNQSLRLVGKNGIGPVRSGHEGNKELGQSLGAPEGKRVVRIGKTARGFALDLAGSAVVQHAKVIVPAKETGHLPYLHRQLGAGFGVDVEQHRCCCQGIVGEGNQRFRLA